MSFDAQPILPARFAEALKDLSLSSLHLKVLELRNSIAHLDYSNEQLRPFALGLEQPLGSATGAAATTTTAAPPPRAEPDPDCVEAIRENEQVIERMQERIRLVRVEVEARGFGWTEFQSKEAEAEERAVAAANGTNGHAEEEEDTDENSAGEQRHAAWTDGTFTTGVIRNREARSDPPAAASSAAAPASALATGSGGGSLTDEELRRRMEERLADLGVGEDDDEGGIHL